MIRDSSGTLYVAAERAGKSAFTTEVDTPSNAFETIPGLDPAVIWGTTAGASIGIINIDAAVTRQPMLPRPGETRLWMITFPPDSVMASPGFDPQAADIEYRRRVPDLVDRFEADNPGMHRTETIDYDIVLDGEIILELDDGECRQLRKGDIVIQYGTRHAWRNRSDKPATLAVIMIGAKRGSDQD